MLPDRIVLDLPLCASVKDLLKDVSSLTCEGEICYI